MKHTPESIVHCLVYLYGYEHTADGGIEHHTHTLAEIQHQVDYLHSLPALHDSDINTAPESNLDDCIVLLLQTAVKDARYKAETLDVIKWIEEEEFHQHCDGDDCVALSFISQDRAGFITLKHIRS